jgi:hypothetical protein
LELISSARPDERDWPEFVWLGPEVGDLGDLAVVGEIEEGQTWGKKLRLRLRTGRTSAGCAAGGGSGIRMLTAPLRELPTGGRVISRAGSVWRASFRERYD